MSENIGLIAGKGQFPLLFARAARAHGVRVVAVAHRHETEPALAESYEANADLTEYTFHLRPNVKWSDGSAFTSADVFATYTAMWDVKNVNHKGNTGTFQYWSGLFGAFLNAPPAQ